MSLLQMVTGPSSIIFWCLLWTEQSRPNKDTTWPYWSANIWTSKWRALNEKDLLDINFETFFRYFIFIRFILLIIIQMWVVSISAAHLIKQEFERSFPRLSNNFFCWLTRNTCSKQQNIYNFLSLYTLINFT